MDPIKVDFSAGSQKGSGGPDKKDSVLIPPEKRGLKIVINLILTVIFGAVLYYFMLPVFNFKNIMMYLFFGLIAAFYCVANYVTSGALRTPDYAPYASKSSLVPKIIIGVLVLVVVVGYIVSSVFFRANSYAKIIDVNGGDFTQEVAEADFSTVPRIDEDTTAYLASRAFSDLSNKLGYASQFTVQPSYYQINYKDTPVRVVSLQYANIIKWITNVKNGLPAYIIVDTTTQKYQLVKVENGIRYSTADHFSHYVTRHVRFQYPTYILDEPTFEIDEEGHPYWIFARLDMTIGLFGGRDVKGAIICDGVTGECREYTIDEIRTSEDLSWIDRVYSANLLVEQYNYYGRYQRGFWNSVLGQKDTYCTTEGYSYLAMNDDVYMYTGVTSLTNDESLTGFVLINQRTKDAKYYVVSGAKETSAQNSADDLVQNYEYKASFPLLLNIDGEATYFMSLKGDSNLVKGYSLANVNDVNIAVTDTTLTGCIEKYVEVLAQNNIKVSVDTDDIKEAADGGENTADTTDTDSPAAKGKTVTGSVTDIRTAVIGGESVYYVQLDGATLYYSVKASDSEEIVLVNKGDTVTLKVKSNGESIAAAALVKD